MAIPMPMVQDIRRLDRQGLSRAEIARRLHVDRGTVAKYADMRDCSPKPKTDRRYGAKIDPYTRLVDSWLEADRLMPRKQRHMIKRVHERLLAETDYDGEYSTTLRYVLPPQVGEKSIETGNIRSVAYARIPAGSRKRGAGNDAGPFPPASAR